MSGILLRIPAFFFLLLSFFGFDSMYARDGATASLPASFPFDFEQDEMAEDTYSPQPHPQLQ